MANETENQIRERAHAIWEEQGQPDGQADQHWQQAETEIIGASGEDASTATDDLPPSAMATSAAAEQLAKPPRRTKTA